MLSVTSLALRIKMLHLRFECPVCGFKDNQLPIEGDGRVGNSYYKI
jgi:hypothetical protein